MPYSESTGIYELGDFQYNSLIIACNQPVSAFVVIEPLPADDEELTRRIESFKQGAADLVRIGLAEEVSKDFETAINQIRDNDGRGSRVYAPTETAYLMFHGSEERPVQ